MTFYLPCLDNDEAFPSVDSALAVPNGLLAFGGELSPARLLKAYQNGIFPWFSNEDPILWWSPNPRGVIKPQEFSPSKSLRKHLRRNELTITLNQATKDVIQLCASTRSEEETWITQQMIDAYKALVDLHYCHSVEVWRENRLIGGLYGLKIGKVFCGESMFSLETNASKIAFWHLCDHLIQMGGELIDCQMLNPHLEKLGVYEIPRKDFIKQLKSLQREEMQVDAFVPQILTLQEQKS
ncbi:MAG: leucyl/phenylalanyl-tRNA--protein transferase [Vibrio sp.]